MVKILFHKQQKIENSKPSDFLKSVLSEIHCFIRNMNTLSVFSLPKFILGTKGSLAIQKLFIFQELLVSNGNLFIFFFLRNRIFLSMIRKDMKIIQNFN